ncbi:MAG TPA: DUF2325 domain-containing protein [Methylomusa anaerophila]|uniref:DUF2325 domain-containing protein n=1 Tax=Methylomusa anaerophila TaxID=1930071 RepID=A0A348AGZ8_9FIRM|nr:DUF2325 domain-containing protein [Methylomusa anaerophila]BBB90346.1 hypothetical protein MAMMFC1_00994 [Methylomusa anaerophila]HML89308.1 DUF2325 domain-containing protein [Methylomusa anaerophila]
MSIVVIGGDHLGSIEKNLYAVGVQELTHISGRNSPAKAKLAISKKTDAVLVLTDYINHNTAAMAKNLAKAHSIPLIFAKRSWTSVAEKLKSEGIIGR